MQKLFFYTKENCLLCDEAYSLVELLIADYPVEVEVIDIYTDDELLEKYHVDIPVVKLNGQTLIGNELTIDRIDSLLNKHSNKPDDEIK